MIALGVGNVLHNFGNQSIQRIAIECDERLVAGNLIPDALERLMHKVAPLGRVESDTDTAECLRPQAQFGKGPEWTNRLVAKDTAATVDSRRLERRCPLIDQRLECARVVNPGPVINGLFF